MKTLPARADHEIQTIRLTPPLILTRSHRIPEAEPDDEPLPDQPLEVPPPITPLTMF